MSLEIFSLTLSFLDINDFQGCDTKVALFDLFNLSTPEKNKILYHWFSHTNFSVSQEFTPPTPNWRRNGKRHRSCDRPATLWVEKNYDSQYWFFSGKQHRLGKPARIIKKRRNEHYHTLGETWYLNGEMHREGNPADIWKYALESSPIYQTWYSKGKKHRIEGPAVETPGKKEWWVDGKLHRIGGPAVVKEKGCNEWWENGVRIQNPNEDSDDCSVLP